MSSEFVSELFQENNDRLCAICEKAAYEDKLPPLPNGEVADDERPRLNDFVVEQYAFVRPCLCPSRYTHKACMS